MGPIFSTRDSVQAASEGRYVSPAGEIVFSVQEMKKAA
jgi:hypothetical protein